MTQSTIVIFAASGDLNARKLMPGLYNLFRKGRLPETTRIVGFARRPWDDAHFRELMHDNLKNYTPTTYDEDLWVQFKPMLSYYEGDLGDGETFKGLARYLDEIEDGPANRLYYLATAPQFFASSVRYLGEAGLADETEGQRNLVIEKPFGHDLPSAHELNDQIHAVFKESQVYRIDHYLGKETAQNILFFRFANTVFESVWNRNYIDNVQITVAESVDVGDRAGYYDQSGVLRDMFQNHILQLLTFIAMEPPSSFEADALRNEKVKVLRSIRPIDLVETVRAQYNGYQQAERVAPDTQTATYFALKLFINNWRWQGVPFYIRSGKALAAKVTECVISFKRPPHLMFNLPPGQSIDPNVLSLCIQPDEGIHFGFQAKKPDSVQEMRTVDMEFHYAESFGDGAIPEAYERLLFEAINGDAALFARHDEIEAAWALVDPIIAGWHNGDGPPLANYAPGTWGPSEADVLLGDRQWILGCLH